MALADELRALVQSYATFDKQKKCYIKVDSKGSHHFETDKSTLLEIDKRFCLILDKILLENTTGDMTKDKDQITKNYRKLCVPFHTDKMNHYSPEVMWLERSLSEDKKDGICFKTLTTRYELLTDPAKFKEFNLADIFNTSIPELKAWLEKQRDGATTFSNRLFYNSLLGLLAQVATYFDEVGTLKLKGLKLLLKALPLLFAGFGAVFAAENLFAVYAVFIVLLKGGQLIEHYGSNQLKMLGTLFQNIGSVTATFTTTVLVRLIELVFVASNKSLGMSMQVSSSFFPSASGSSSSDSPPLSRSFEAVRDELILASKNTAAGVQFEHPELKLLVAPLESCLRLYRAQFFSSWRAAGTKRDEVEAFIAKVLAIDKEPTDIEDKLRKARAALAVLEQDKTVYEKGKNTANAIDNAIKVISFLQHDEQMQLVVYKGPGMQ